MTPAVAAALTSGAAPAFAAQRFAAPSPAGSHDCSSPANARDFPTAVGGAGTGDEVIVTPGTYGPFTSEVDVLHNNVAIHGIAGQPRPRILLNVGPDGIVISHGGVGFATSTSTTAAATRSTSPSLAAGARASPTVDAGINDPANGAFDADGNLRTLGARTDIGAYELTQAPAVAYLAPMSLNPSAESINGTVNPNGGATSYHFEWGPTPALGSSTPAQPLGPATTPQTVSANISGLAPGTPY